MLISALLSQRLRESFGDEAADEMVDWMQRMRAGFAKGHAETAQLEVRFERRFNDMMRWSLLFWVNSLGTVVALLQFRQSLPLVPYGSSPLGP